MAQTKAKAKSKAKAKTKTKSRAKAKARPKTKAKNSSSPKAELAKATGKASDAVGSAAGKASDAASKAKVPLIASGAALVGAAGGMALGVRKSHNGHRGLTKAAKGAGEFGARVGHLATELQRNREAANGGDPHRSPVEVVLDGLTSRR